MASRRRRLDPVGPFGNPDGSRADIEDVIGEFVDFGGDLAYGHLATRANDSMVRVIVGKLGAGKTVYLRRLQDFQSHQDSVYADAPQQSLPKTEVVVKACQWFSDRVLVEKWMQIWDRAIMRSLASHLLRHPELRQQIRDEQAAELEHSYGRLLDDFRRPRSIYTQVRDIINQRQTAYQLSTYLDDPLWDDLEDLLGEVIGSCKPIYFYLDALDEEFSHAPMYWLKCQEGLFYQVMRLLRDHRLGGRLHVVVCIRDIVMSSVYRSEHAPRYYNEPHIRVLNWDRGSLLYLLSQKLQRLPSSLLMRRGASGPPTIRDWLGIDGQVWPGPTAGRGTIEDYLLGHTRLIPRDIISLGNDLSEEVLRQKKAGHAGLPPEALAAVVQRCAKRFGDSQLAQCANQISSDLMPSGAALHDYSELFTSTQAYISGVQEEVRSFVRMIGVDRFSAGGPAGPAGSGGSALREGDRPSLRAVAERPARVRRRGRAAPVLLHGRHRAVPLPAGGQHVRAASVPGARGRRDPARAGGLRLGPLTPSALARRPWPGWHRGGGPYPAAGVNLAGVGSAGVGLGWHRLRWQRESERPTTTSGTLSTIALRYSRSSGRAASPRSTGCATTWRGRSGRSSCSTAPPGTRRCGVRSARCARSGIRTWSRSSGPARPAAASGT